MTDLRTLANTSVLDLIIKVYSTGQVQFVVRYETNEGLEGEIRSSMFDESEYCFAYLYMKAFEFLTEVKAMVPNEKT